MHNLFTVILATLLISACSTQSKPDANLRAVSSALKCEVQEIKSLDTGDFSDLSFLKTTLQDKRVILLGESSHGAAEFYQLKSRIARYLVHEMNFEVIAFESGVFECQRADDLVLERSAEYLMRKCLMWELFPTAEVLPLFQFVQSQRREARRVHLAGFDSEVTGFRGPTTNFETFDRAMYFKQVIESISPKYAKEVYQLEKEYVQFSGDEKADNGKRVSAYYNLVKFLETNQAKISSRMRMPVGTFKC